MADAKHQYREAHPAMVIPLSITAAISVLIGLYPELLVMRSSSNNPDFMKLVKLIEFLRHRLKLLVRVCFGLLATADPGRCPVRQ